MSLSGPGANGSNTPSFGVQGLSSSSFISLSAPLWYVAGGEDTIVNGDVKADIKSALSLLESGVMGLGANPPLLSSIDDGEEGGMMSAEEFLSNLLQEMFSTTPN